MMLTIAGLVAGYPGGGTVLHGVDLAIGEGECVALMGRNGMGKTTLLKVIMGHVRARSGHIRLDRAELAGRPPYEISNLGIAYVPQGREIFRDFTVEENLLLGVIGKRRLPVQVPPTLYERFPILAERRHQRAGTMSGGEQQQLAIARAIIAGPRLLLLDEPTEGLAPSIVQSIAFNTAEIARERNMSILVVEQNLDLVLPLAARCLFMENGRIVGEAPVETLRGDRALVHRYLSV